MIEDWVPIEGYNGLYEVSDQGRVRSLPRHTTKGKILSPSTDKKGYMRVSLCREGIVKVYLLSRLVALAFIPNMENKPTVNHKNGRNKYDNSKENLEWATYSEQEQHAHSTGLSCKVGDGVYKQNKRWIAAPQSLNTRVYLGVFSTQKEALIAVKKHRK